MGKYAFMQRNWIARFVSEGKDSSDDGFVVIDVTLG